MENIVTIGANEKIGLIADVHGNYPYLKIVIQELIDSGVNHFIFLGDMITDFQGTKEILKLIKAIQYKYPTNIILGNREVDMIEREKGNRDFWKKELHNGNLLLTYNDLTKEDLQFLNTLPENLVLEFPNGDKALVVHSSELSEEQRKFLADNNIKIIICGHMHRAINADMRQENDLWYINPGSVGLTEDAVSFGGTYGILNATEKNIKYEQMQFKADKETILKLYKDIFTNKDLCASYWPLILDLSIKTGRNMASVFFVEIRRLTGLYSKDESERIANGFYKPMEITEHLTGCYNVDIYGNIITVPQTYMRDWSTPFIKYDFISANFPFDFGILNNEEIRNEIYNIALNNTLYYSSVYEVNGLGNSYIEEVKNTSYMHR